MKVAGLCWSRLAVVAGVLLACLGQFVDIVNLYEGMQLFSDSKIFTLNFDSPEKLNLRKVEHSETSISLVLEYQINREGVVVLPVEVPNNPPESQFKLYVDYILEDIPFILGSLTLDLTNEDQNEIFNLFTERDFDEGVVRTECKIIRRMNMHIWTPENLQLLNSLVTTHRFAVYTSARDKLEIEDIALNGNNEELVAELRDSLDQNKFLRISGDQFKGIIQTLLENVVNFGFREVLNALEDDSSLSRPDLLEQKKEAIRKKYDVLKQVEPIIREYEDLIEQNKEPVFDSPSIEAGMERVRAGFESLESTHLLLSAGLFYISKYYFESGQASQDPVEVLGEFGKEAKGPTQLENAFVDVLRELTSVMTAFLKTAFHSNGFAEQSEEIIGKFIENVFGYFQSMGYSGEEDSELIEDVKGQLKRLFIDRHVNEMLLFKGLDPIFEKLKEFVNDKDFELFSQMQIDKIKSDYLQFGSIEHTTNSAIDYETFPGELFRGHSYLVL